MVTKHFLAKLKSINFILTCKFIEKPKTRIPGEVTLISEIDFLDRLLSDLSLTFTYNLQVFFLFDPKGHKIQSTCKLKIKSIIFKRFF